MPPFLTALAAGCKELDATGTAPHRTPPNYAGSCWHADTCLAECPLHHLDQGVWRDATKIGMASSSSRQSRQRAALHPPPSDVALQIVSGATTTRQVRQAARLTPGWLAARQPDKAARGSKQ